MPCHVMSMPILIITNYISTFHSSSMNNPNIPPRISQSSVTSSSPKGWLPFSLGQGWQSISKQYGSLNSTIHICKRYILDPINNNITHQKYVIKVMPFVVATHSDQSLFLKYRTADQINSQIRCLQKLQKDELFVNLYQVLIEGQNLEEAVLSQLLGIAKKSGVKHVCLVMEYCQAGSLMELLREGIAETQLIHYSIKILLGLLKLKKKGIIHRDLHPRNIFLKDNHMIKIADFDTAFLSNQSSLSDFLILSKQQVVSKQIAQLLATDIDELQQFTQTQLYQLQQNYDVFCLGVMMYEFVTLKEYSVGSRSQLSDNLEQMEHQYSIQLLNFIYNLLSTQKLKEIDCEAIFIELVALYNDSLHQSHSNKQIMFETLLKLSKNQHKQSFSLITAELQHRLQQNMSEHSQFREKTNESVSLSFGTEEEDIKQITEELVLQKKRTKQKIRTNLYHQQNKRPTKKNLTNKQNMIHVRLMSSYQ